MSPTWKYLAAVAGYKEQSIIEVLRLWSWGMFCDAWVEMIDYKRRDTLRDRRRKRKTEAERTLQETQRAMAGLLNEF